jgi:aspartate aminotransferase
MPRNLASRLDVVAPSVTLAMNARAAELRARGVDVFSFGVGEPDFEPPRHVLEAAKRAIDEGASKYTAVSGIPQLRKAIAARASQRRGLPVAPDEVIVSVGAKHALFNLALALFEPGDEVVIPAPYWVSYPEQVRLMGAEPVIVETQETRGWRMTPAELEAALTPRTKAVVLCSPSNPTGATYPEHELRALLQVLREHDCWLVTDEIYADLAYDFPAVSPLALAPDLRERIAVVDGVSKSYAMTGWRIGWVVAPKPLVRALDTIQGQSTTNATAVAQHAALAALEGPQDEVAAMREAFHRRRDVMCGGLDALPGVRCRRVEGAFYAFADVRGLYGIRHGEKTLASEEDVAFWLLDAARVAGVPGGSFGAPGYVRFSFAAGEDRILAGLASMASAIGTANRG